MIDAATPGGVAEQQLGRLIRHRQCCSTGTLRWTCVRSWPQAERWAEQNLRRCGYEAWLPLVTARQRDRVVRSLWHTVQAPLFGSYLFLRIDPEASWTPIRETPGVRNLVKCGQTLAFTSDMAVEALRRAVDGAEALAAVVPHGRRRRRPGDAVAPVAGPFAGHHGVVLEVGADKTLISLLLFGALREVLVRSDNLVEREV